MLIPNEPTVWELIARAFISAVVLFLMLLGGHLLWKRILGGDDETTKHL